MVGTLIFFALAVFLSDPLRSADSCDELRPLWRAATFPLTTQGSAWYAGISLAGIMLMAAIALYAFYTSVGGRPVFAGATFEE